MKEPALLNSRYQLLERLGTGGMADVYRARDLTLDRHVAIKILHRNYSADATFQNNFRLEARSAANLSHPNIVTVHDFGFTDDMLYIVMEYVPGKDMKQLIRERGRLSVEVGIPLIIQACAGLGYAHRAGLVHCDVKPHNMIVSPDGHLKVTDFGIARALSTIIPGQKDAVVWGSPLYFSPEQARGESLSPASDVYSMGVVMYEVLSGAPPFVASTSSELARLHISAQPIPIREYVPDIPSSLEEIIMKVLSKEPSARYRTADQLGRVLSKYGNYSQETESSYKSSSDTAKAPPSSTQISYPATSTRNLPAREPDLEQEGSSFRDIDWVVVMLALIALLAVGGLIPFWMMIYFSYNPPIR